MKSREYWAERLRIQEEARNRKNVEYLKQLEKAFTIERNNIAGQIEAWYGRLAENNGVSMAEARKMLSRSELKEFKWTLEEYIKYGQENAIDGRWMKQLENASAKSHISRLEALELELRHKVEKLYGEYGVSLETHLTSQLKSAYKDGMSLAGIDATFNTEKAKTVLSKPWTTDGRTFSDRVWKQKTEMVDFLHTEMTRMVITGETPKRLTEELKNKFGVSLSSAKRLVNTETAHLASVANKQMFEDLDVEYYEILAEIDGKTSDICRSLDGQVFEMKIFEEGVTAPPFHVSCRSITAPWFPDEDETDGYGKTLNVNASHEKEYAKYSVGEKEALRIGQKEPMIFREVTGDHVKNPTIISDRVKVSPKEMHEIQVGYEKARKVMGIGKGQTPTLAICAESEMKPGTIAAYNAKYNIVRVKKGALTRNQILGVQNGQTAADDSPISTFVHELFHFKDAEVYKTKYGIVGRMTDAQIREWMKWCEERSRKALDNLNLPNETLMGVSKYANMCIKDDQLDEVYTEYRVLKMLKGGAK